MIKKCAQQIMKTAIPSPFCQSVAAYPLAFQFSQQKINLSSSQSKTEETVKQNTVSYFSADSNPRKSDIIETFNSEDYGTSSGRIHGFKGQQRSYFAFVAGLLLLLNVAARLSMPHETHFHSYEKTKK